MENKDIPVRHGVRECDMVPPKRYTYEELPLEARMIIEHGDPIMDRPGFYKWEDGFWYDFPEPSEDVNDWVDDE